VQNHSFGVYTLVLLGSTIRLSVRPGRYLTPLRGTAARLFRFSIACVWVLCDRVSYVQNRKAYRCVHKKYNTYWDMTTRRRSWPYRGGAMLNFAVTEFSEVRRFPTDLAINSATRGWNLRGREIGRPDLHQPDTYAVYELSEVS
jgi:hypothetical protein